MRVVILGSGVVGVASAWYLAKAGHEVTVVDNLCNAKEESLRRVMGLSGKTLTFHPVDLRDKAALRAVFSGVRNRVDAVIHFAGLKAVGESVAKPLLYYDNNVTGSVALFETMTEAGVNPCSRAAEYRNGLNPEPGWRCACVTRLNLLL